MDNVIPIKYSTYSKVLQPQPIRMAGAKWGGSPEKMENGSEPQPWHCLPFVEGSTYGLELIYPYEMECHVVGADGTIRFDWDFPKEPGSALTGGEFRAFAPVDASKYYVFSTRLDLLPPPGYALRTEPHPRYFTDDTGTVPLAMIGHLQSEWYPRLLFLVFRAPKQGERHIFRKGEPFAQILFVPRHVKYEMTPMSMEEAAQRRDLEQAVEVARLDIAENVWRNNAGVAFNNHYKVLARAFARDGMSGIKEVVKKVTDQREKEFAKDKTIPELMNLALQRMREQKYEQADEILTHVINRDPNHAAAYSALGVCFSSVANFKNAVTAMTHAATLRPDIADYQMNLGELHRRLGHFSDAEASFRRAIALNPRDPEFLSALGLTLSQQGRNEEALQAFRAAIATGTPTPPAYYGMGTILAQQGRTPEARQCFQAALSIAPMFTLARKALEELPQTVS